VESSKKIQGKITPFGERIIKVLKLNNLIKPNGEVNYAEAERMCGIKSTGLSKAVQGNGMHDGNLEKFLGTFQIEKDWLLSGIGAMQSEHNKEKHASVEIRSKNKEKALGEDLIRKEFIEKTTDYRMVPKTILDGEYRMVLKADLDERTQLLKKSDEYKDKYIAKLENDVLKLETRVEQLEAQFIHPKNTK
jgi:hypothetical protein